MARVCALLSAFVLPSLVVTAQPSEADSDECPLVQLQRRVARARTSGSMESGAVIPMDVLTMWNGRENFTFMSLNMTPSPTEELVLPDMPVPKQRLALDLGSSTVAFCNPLVADQAQSTTKFTACQAYGGYKYLGFWGPIYHGCLDVEGNVTLNSSYYAVMQTQFFMPCYEGFAGIFGAAFGETNKAFEEFSPVHWSSTLDCPEVPTTTLGNPWIDSVRSSYGSHFGIGWSGLLGYGEAELFAGSAAVSNPYYQRAPAAGKTKILPGGVYFVNITGYSFEGIDVPYTCAKGSFEDCLIDSGNPQISFPSEILKRINAKGTGTVTIELDNFFPCGSPVKLDLDVATMLEAGWVTNEADVGVVSLPVFAFYYFHFNVNEEAPWVEFVPQGVPKVLPGQGAPGEMAAFSRPKRRAQV